jgi:hypothetical protein
MMKLTPKTLEKFNLAQPSTRIFNGNYAAAVVEVFNNRNRYELRYEMSHPSLEVYSGQIDKAELIVWTGHNGVHVPVPEELASIVSRAKKSAQDLLDEKASELAAGMREAVHGFNEAFCLAN